MIKKSLLLSLVASLSLLFFGASFAHTDNYRTLALRGNTSDIQLSGASGGVLINNGNPPTFSVNVSHLGRAGGEYNVTATNSKTNASCAIYVKFYGGNLGDSRFTCSGGMNATSAGWDQSCGCYLIQVTQASK